MPGATNIYIFDSRAFNVDLLSSLSADDVWFVLDANQGGVEQIRDLLAGYSNIGALHVVSHGSEGALLLGSTTIDAQNVDSWSSALAEIGAHISSDGDLLLYGCDVARGSDGLALIMSLAQQTGADVAASSDATGAASMGGNWTLEAATGRIESASLAAPDYAGLLGATGNHAPARAGNLAVLPAGKENVQYVVAAVDLLAGYADQDGDPLSVLGLAASNGTITANANGTYTITPVPGFNGTMTLSYDVVDGFGGAISAQQSYAVTANTAPSLAGAKAVLADGSEDVAYVVSSASLLAGYSDVDGDALSVTGLAADHGAVAVNANGTFTITPAANYNGPMALTYTVVDARGKSVGATQAVQIAAVNDAPLHDAAPFLVEAGRQPQSIGSHADGRFVALSDGSYAAIWTEMSVNSSLYVTKLQMFSTLDTPRSGVFDIGTSYYMAPAMTPQIADLGSNRFAVVWQASETQTYGGLNDIKAQVFYRTGGALTAPVTVGTVGSQTVTNPSISAFANGDFVVAWQDDSGQGGDGSGYGIKLQRFDVTGGKIGAEARVNTTALGNQVKPDVVALDDGRAVVFWVDTASLNSNPSNCFIRGQIVDASGVKQGSEITIALGSQANTGWNTAGSVQFDVAALTEGRFALIWSDNATAKVQTFDALGHALGATAFSTLPRYFAGNPIKVDIIGIGDGRFMAAWTELSYQVANGGSNTAHPFLTQTFSADGSPIGDPKLLSTVPYGTPQLEVLADGSVLASLGGTDIAHLLPVVGEGLEDTPYTISAANLLAGFSDVEGDALTVTGLAASTGQVTANPDGSYTIIAPGNFAGPVTLSYVVSDGHGGNTPATLTYQVVNVPDAPIITSNGAGDTASISLAENVKEATTVTATDPDVGTTLVYSVSGGTDAALFQIDQTTGALSFRSAPDFEVPKDVGGNNVYDVVVQVSDGALTDTQALAITVTNVGAVIVGAPGNDEITPTHSVSGQELPTSDDDVISGLGGNDTLSAGTGNDTLDGGPGVDLVVYAGTRSAATVTRNPDRSQTVATSADGTDTVRHVEQLKFSDGLYSFTFANPGSALVANFNPSNGWTNQDQAPRHVADVNGDGFADIVGFGTAGVLVAFGSANGSFGPVSLAVGNFGQTAGWTSDNAFHRVLADVNGDGRADIIGFGQAGTLVSLAQANGTFAAPVLGIANFGAAQGWTSDTAFHRVVGDVNGDGKADIVGFGQAGTLVALGNGDGTFKPVQSGLANFGAAQGWASDNTFHRELADVNGDGKADIIGFGQAGTLVALSNSDGTFQPVQSGLANFGTAQGWASQDSFARLVADVNGDHIGDIVGFGQAGTLVAFGNGDGTFTEAGFDLANFGAAQGWTSDATFHREVADLNHDGLADIVGFGFAGVLVGINQGDFLV